MRMGRAHADCREQAKTKNHRHDENRIGKCTGRQRNHAHVPKHNRIGNAHKHLTHEPYNDGQRQVKCASVFP